MFGGWQESREVEIGAAQKDFVADDGEWLKSGLGSLVIENAVDWVIATVDGLWKFGASRFERWFPCEGSEGEAWFPFDTTEYPLLQHFDFGGVQPWLICRWHLLSGIVAEDAFDDARVFGVTGDDISGIDEQLAGVQREAAACFAPAVAGNAVFPEDREDCVRKIVGRLLRRQWAGDEECAAGSGDEAELAEVGHARTFSTT